MRECRAQHFFGGCFVSLKLTQWQVPYKTVNGLGWELQNPLARYSYDKVTGPFTILWFDLTQIRRW